MKRLSGNMSHYSSSSSQPQTQAGDLPTTIPDLVAYIKGGAGTNRAPGAAARALWALSYNNPANQLQIAACEGINPLAQLLACTYSEDAVQAACCCLWNVASNPELHAAVGASGAIPLLVQLMQGELATAATLEAAAGTLSALACNSPDHCKQIKLVGGITAVVRMLCAPSNTDAARQCSASTLCSLAITDSSNHQLITAAGGVMALLPLLRADCSKPAVLQQVALALKALALDSSNQTVIAALGGIQVLVTLISSSADEATLWASAGALRNLVCDHKLNQQALTTTPGALAALVKVLQDSSRAQSLLHQTAAVITCLACNPKNHQALLTEPGCLTALIQLLDPKHYSPTTMERAAAALSILAVNETAQHTLRRVGAIQTLVRLLGSNRCDRLLYEQVGSALFNLAHNNPSRQAAMRGAGAIQIIKQVVGRNKSTSCDTAPVSHTAVQILNQLLSVLQSNLSRRSVPAPEAADSNTACNATAATAKQEPAVEQGSLGAAVSDLAAAVSGLFPRFKPTAAAEPLPQQEADDLAHTGALSIDQVIAAATAGSVEDPSSSGSSSGCIPEGEYDTTPCDGRVVLVAPVQPAGFRSSRAALPGSKQASPAGKRVTAKGKPASAPVPGRAVRAALTAAFGDSCAAAGRNSRTRQVVSTLTHQIQQTSLQRPAASAGTLAAAIAVQRQDQNAVSGPSWSSIVQEGSTRVCKDISSTAGAAVVPWCRGAERSRLWSSSSSW